MQNRQSRTKTVQFIPNYDALFFSLFYIINLTDFCTYCYSFLFISN
ncbi:hypothetical protein CLOSTMETH_02371 [[Clostridium] methylpentosum DSM 5476]|uniref:Uncharacterized protein n=1 Tax=[Clostridium] methylpentosum DSM 5476 TaxID=537013 RepID=C0EET2_9FIRM|nr:hypothetical protein CLOSTMETH_02371 [[Clostridium] methylpentosum DSM 5476]